MADLIRDAQDTIQPKHEFSEESPSVRAEASPTHTNATRIRHNALRAELLNQLEEEIETIAQSIGNIDRTEFYKLVGAEYKRETLGSKIASLATSITTLTESTMSSLYLYKLFGKGIYQGYLGEFQTSVGNEEQRILKVSDGSAILPTAALDYTEPTSVTVAAVNKRAVGVPASTGITNPGVPTSALLNYEEYTLDSSPDPGDGRGWVEISGTDAIVYVNKVVVAQGGIVGTDIGLSSGYPTFIIQKSGVPSIKTDLDTALITSFDAKAGTFTIDLTEGTLASTDTIRVAYKYHTRRIDTLSIYADSGNDNQVTIDVQQGDDYDPEETAVAKYYTNGDEYYLNIYYLNIDPEWGWTESDGISDISLKQSMLEDIRTYLPPFNVGNGTQIGSSAFPVADNAPRKTKLTVDGITAVSSGLQGADVISYIDTVYFDIEHDGAYHQSTQRFGTYLPSTDTFTASKTADGASYRIRVEYDPKTVGIGQTIAAHIIQIATGTYDIDTDSTTASTQDIYIPAFTIDRDEAISFYVNDEGSTFYDYNMSSLARESDSTQYISVSQSIGFGTGLKQSQIQKYSISHEQIAPDILFAHGKLGIGKIYTEFPLDERSMIIKNISDDQSTNGLICSFLNEKTIQYVVSSPPSGGRSNVNIVRNYPNSMIHTVNFYNVTRIMQTETINHPYSGNYGIHYYIHDSGSTSGLKPIPDDIMIRVTNKNNHSFDLNVYMLTNSIWEVLTVDVFIVHEDMVYMQYAGADTSYTLNHNLGTLEHITLLVKTDHFDHWAPGLTFGENTDTITNASAVGFECSILKLIE